MMQACCQITQSSKPSLRRPHGRGVSLSFGFFCCALDPRTGIASDHTPALTSTGLLAGENAEITLRSWPRSGESFQVLFCRYRNARGPPLLCVFTVANAGYPSYSSASSRYTPMSGTFDLLPDSLNAAPPILNAAG